MLHVQLVIADYHFHFVFVCRVQKCKNFHEGKDFIRRSISNWNLICIHYASWYPSYQAFKFSLRMPTKPLECLDNTFIIKFWKQVKYKPLPASSYRAACVMFHEVLLHLVTFWGMCNPEKSILRNTHVATTYLVDIVIFSWRLLEAENKFLLPINDATLPTCALKFHITLLKFPHKGLFTRGCVKCEVCTF